MERCLAEHSCSQPGTNLQELLTFPVDCKEGLHQIAAAVHKTPNAAHDTANDQTNWSGFWGM